MNIFDEFKDYIKNNGYNIEEITEDSIRGIKNKFVVHLFFDYKYDNYVLYISDDGYKLWATIFESFENGYRLDHENEEKILFSNFQEVINFTNENLVKKI